LVELLLNFFFFTLLLQLNLLFLMLLKLALLQFQDMPFSYHIKQVSTESCLIQSIMFLCDVEKLQVLNAQITSFKMSVLLPNAAPRVLT